MIATIQDIQRLTCHHFDLLIDELVSARRHRRLAHPRMIAMFLCREHTGISLPRIGKRFGGRDHTTVLHACRKVKHWLKTDHDYADHVTALRRKIARFERVKRRAITNQIILKPETAWGVAQIRRDRALNRERKIISERNKEPEVVADVNWSKVGVKLVPYVGYEPGDYQKCRWEV